MLSLNTPTVSVVLQENWAGPRRDTPTGKVKGGATETLPMALALEDSKTEASLPSFGCRKSKSEMVWETVLTLTFHSSVSENYNYGA